MIAEKEKRYKKRDPYIVFTVIERARTAKYATENGVAAARRGYSAQALNSTRALFMVSSKGTYRNF